MTQVDVNLPVALTMLLSDYNDTPVNVNFFHARSHGDFDELFELAATLYHSKKTPKIVINGGDGAHVDGGSPGEAWPGADFWEGKLIDFGIPQNDIYRTKAAFNTKEENEEFLRVAKVHNWRSAIISGCQPHQILRAFLGFLKSMIDNDYWMRVYPCIQRQKMVSFWWQKVYAFSAMFFSNDLPPQKYRFRERFDLMPFEFLRIPEYQVKGHLATFEEFFSYLKRRHTIF